MVGRAEEKGEGCLKSTIRPGAGGAWVRAGVEEVEAMKRSAAMAPGLFVFRWPPAGSAFGPRSRLALVGGACRPNNPFASVQRNLANGRGVENYDMGAGGTA